MSRTPGKDYSWPGHFRTAECRQMIILGKLLCAFECVSLNITASGLTACWAVGSQRCLQQKIVCQLLRKNSYKSIPITQRHSLRPEAVGFWRCGSGTFRGVTTTCSTRQDMRPHSMGCAQKPYHSIGLWIAVEPRVAFGVDRHSLRRVTRHSLLFSPPADARRAVLSSPGEPNVLL